jgi:hypothetical protein
VTSWYRIESRSGEGLPGFPEVIFADGEAFTTDPAAVAAARSNPAFGVAKIKEEQLQPGFYFDKELGIATAFDGTRRIPLGGSDFLAEVEDVGGIAIGQPVVMGSAWGKVSAVLPESALAWNVVGVALSNGILGAKITVRSYGLVLALAGMAIAAGDNVGAKGASSRCFIAPPPSTTTGAGNSGLRWRLRRPGMGGHTNAVQVSVPAEPDSALSVVVSANLIRVNVATDENGDPASTALEVAAALNGDPAASQLVFVSQLGDGSGTPGSATATFGLNFESVNAIGIALAAAAEADDLFPILLRTR